MQGETYRQIPSLSLWVRWYRDYIAKCNFLNEISLFFSTGDTLGTRGMNTIFFKITNTVATIYLSILCLHKILDFL